MAKRQEKAPRGGEGTVGGQKGSGQKGDGRRGGLKMTGKSKSGARKATGCKSGARRSTSGKSGVRKAVDRKAVEKAHFWLVKSLDALDEARALAGSGRTRAGAWRCLLGAASSAATALLRVSGSSARGPKEILAALRKSWVRGRGLPARYAELLGELMNADRALASGEWVATDARTLERSAARVEKFVARARRELPPMSITRLLGDLAAQNPLVRDLSFDVYCPRTYFHHTRLTLWCPKGRISEPWLARMRESAIRTIRELGVKEAGDYVVGLNSRVNQYEARHIVMLDFDDVSTAPEKQLRREPGVFFRTGSGIHFIGTRLYAAAEWEKRMKSYASIASEDHIQLSLQRGYATLRLTASPRKPLAPVFMGRPG
ncbi:MAG: hypothetical protein RBU30_08690 [Polyangia bacterium]|nr:hypothetical protein [Polyangia bacterium]